MFEDEDNTAMTEDSLAPAADLISIWKVKEG